MAILQIIDTPYRCTIEEQDDPALWIIRIFKSAGTDLALLLRGAAVNYAVKGQDARGLSFGRKAQTQPPQLDRDVLALLARGVRIFVVADDVEERGLKRGDLVADVETIPRAAIAGLFDRFEQIWHW